MPKREGEEPSDAVSRTALISHPSSSSEITSMHCGFHYLSLTSMHINIQAGRLVGCIACWEIIS